MRVVLIGAGATGSVAATHLVREKEIDGIVLADMIPERAKALEKKVGSPKARAAPFPGTSVGDLAKLVKGSHLAINAAHVSLDLALMEACLDAGAHYMDLSSLPSQQFPFDARFRKAGLTALLGGGEDPGIANVLARAAADTLDTVDRVRIRDGDTAWSADTPLPVVWSPETFLAEVFTPGLYFEDGKIVHVPPWSGKEIYLFPEPVGPQPVYLMDHEEPETLGKFLGKGLRYADLKLAVDDTTYATLNMLQRLGVLSDEPVIVDGQPVVPKKVLMKLLPRPTDLIGKVQGAAMIVVEVDGTRDGRPTSLRLWTGMSHAEAAKRHGATATGYLVGTGAALFAMQFARGRVDRAGVIAAECLDPAESLRLLARYDLPVTRERREATPLN